MAIFPSREDPIPGVSGSMVASQIPLPAEQVHFQPSWLQVAPLLASLARPGDLVLTLGAGDIAMIGREVLTSLADQDESASVMNPLEDR